MALHTTLEIHKAGYALLRLASQAHRHMPRDFKNSLGVEIHRECISILVLIARANAADDQDRAQYIKTMLEHVDVATLLLRLAHDEKLVANELWGLAVRTMDSIGKQGGGWLNFTRKNARKASAT